MFLVTSAQMRDIEERAIRDISIPSLLLMENAALQTVKHIKGRSAVILCGTGNNGGDGLAIARLLHVKGIKVKVVIVGDIKKIKGDALINLQIVQKMDLLSDEPLDRLLASADVVVDALFGTGFRGAAQGDEALAIKDINQAVNQPVSGCAAQIISVDIPSGVEADTGRVTGPAVRADLTVTFAVAKVGHILFPGTEFAGRLIVEDISIPKGIISGPYLEVLDDSDIVALLPPRKARSNKGTYGKVCVLAGCNDMPGAAALCCKAAYRAGAGLVHARVEPEVARVIRTSSHEVITSTASYTGFDDVKDAAQAASVIALGPGIGRGADRQKFVLDVIANSKKPMVIDADGLIAIAAKKSVLKEAKAPIVLTPHPGEMAELCGTAIPEVLEDIVGCAQKFAREHGVVVLLKDARTIIAAPNGRTFVNLTGTPALAKAGSGDVLTGIIAAFMAQGIDALLAAASGAFIHGRAGQLAAEKLSTYGVVAGDVAEYIPLCTTDTMQAFQLPAVQSSTRHVPQDKLR